MPPEIFAALWRRARVLTDAELVELRYHGRSATLLRGFKAVFFAIVIGLPSMLRWLWWRVNAWTEIVGMVVATAAALVLYPLFPDTRDEYLLLAIVTIAMTAALAATFLTPPVPREHLARFVGRVRPPGWWPGLPGAAPRPAMAWTATAWVAGNVGVFGLTFGIGHLLLGSRRLGALLLLAGGVAIVGTLRATSLARAHARYRICADEPPVAASQE